MVLMRYDPFQRLERAEGFDGQATPFIPLDAVRRGDLVELRFDLPGVSPDSIEVDVERNVLTVSGERRWAPAENEEVLARERPQGTFRRHVLLGDTLDSARLEAHYDQGVLTVRVPVAEQAKPRKVEIHVGTPEGETLEVGSAAR